MALASQLTPTQVIEALWKAGKLRYKLHSAQQKIYDDLQTLPPTVREALLFISRRFGKSYLITLMACEDAIKTGKSILIIGPTKDQTREIISPILADIASDAPKGFVSIVKSELRWKVGKGMVILGGFEAALESTRGRAFNNIYIEETGLADVSPEDYMYTLKSVLLPTLQHSRGRILHATTPARRVDHPLHTITIPRTKLQNSFYTYTIHDNPLLTKEQIEAEIQEMGGPDSIHVRRELLCEICKDETTAIVPKFKREQVVRPTLGLKYLPVLLSGDFGGVKDKSVFHLIGCEESSGKIIFLDERSFEPETPTAEIVKQLREMEGSAEDLVKFVDCPGQLDIDLAITHKYPILRPKKKAFETGITELRHAFNSDNVIIDPKCKLLILTLEHGGFNKQRNDFSRSTELGHCDAAASAIYGVRHFFEKFPVPKIDRTLYHRERPSSGSAIANLMAKVFRT